MKQAGNIHLIMGPMFSGKTTELFRLIKRYKIAGRETVIIKYSGDDRYDDPLLAYTHDQVNFPAFVTSLLSLVERNIREKNITIIGIDEGQFYADLVEQSTKWANEGKTVIIAALNGDYKQAPFTTISNLIPHAERISKLSAICGCGDDDALYSTRLVPGTEQELIGDASMYRSVCRKCLSQSSINVPHSD